MEKFYLGMDIGTNSVDMACTDENYNLLRAKGMDCCLFAYSTRVKRRRNAEPSEPQEEGSKEEITAFLFCKRFSRRLLMTKPFL